ARRRRPRRTDLGSERRRRQGKRLSLFASRQTGPPRSARDGERRRPGVKVYLRTFGCRANHYDSEAVRELVERAGHAIVDCAGDADAAVFNSCTVTADAEADLRQAVRRAARERPGLRSVVMGCAAARPDADRPEDARIGALPSVQSVVAGADLGAVAAALELSVAP